MDDARTSAPSPVETRTGGGSSRKAIFAIAIGTVIEWFDFTLYGFSSVVLASVFFPAEERVAGILGALALYGVSFVVRPLGAVIFGRLGDRSGRRTALTASILLMSAATAGVGLLPSYESIGFLAPTLLLVCRLMQGLSTGGEHAGGLTSAAEYAPANRRGRWTGFLSSCGYIGASGATLLVLFFQIASPEDYAAGGWRWPFLIGGAVALIGFYFRYGLAETPAFEQSRRDRTAAGVVDVRPFGELVRHHRKEFWVLFGYFALIGILTHALLGYMPIYLAVTLEISQATSLIVMMSALLVVAVAMPLVSSVSDAHGRRPVILTGLVATVVVTVPAYLLIGTRATPLVVAGLITLLIPITLTQAGVAGMLEVFPTHVRYTGMATAYGLAYAVFAGTAPLVSELLIGLTGSNLAPAFYPVVVSLLVAPLLWRGLPETHRVSLTRSHTSSGGVEQGSVRIGAIERDSSA